MNLCSCQNQQNNWRRLQKLIFFVLLCGIFRPYSQIGGDGVRHVRQKFINLKKMIVDIDRKHQSVQHCYCSVISHSHKLALTTFRFVGQTEDSRSSCNEVQIILISYCISIGVQTEEFLLHPKAFFSFGLTQSLTTELKNMEQRYIRMTG